MIDFLQSIIAARDRGNGKSWLIPLVVFAIYIGSGIAKYLSNKAAEDKQDTSGRKPEPRYKPLEDKALPGQGGRPSMPAVQGQNRPQEAAEPGAQPQQWRPEEGQRQKPEAVRPLDRDRPIRAPQPRQEVPIREAAERPGPSYYEQEPVAESQGPWVQPVRPQAPVGPRPVSRERPVQPRSKPIAAKPKQVQPRKIQLAKKEAAAPEKAPAEASFRSLLLQNLKGRDNLKRAILYSEILGKPLALR